MTALRPAPAPGTAGARRPGPVRLLWLLVVVGVLAALAAASIAVGSRGVGWSDVLAALGGSSDDLGQAAVTKRIPRTVLAVLVGAALGLSGAVMQGVTRNPLADPGVLGINSGASLAVVAGLAWFGLFSAASIIWTAIAGAAVSTVFVYAVGALGRGGPTPLKLALAGAATAAALTSFITAIALPRGDLSVSIQSWEVGGVGGATSATITPVLPFLAVGLVVSLLSARSLNSLALGDDLAAGLGERVALARGLAAAGSVLLCGAATAVAGPIGFVGLVVPHLCRLLVGVDHRWLLPFTALTGACLLVGADVLGRIVARPSEIDVGIVTALVGAPFFIALVRRQRMREL
ncbi:iron complex transport system permease protein [Geodermatophilus amargosae]|uniref:Iron complex transport system permease protein n=1 Tax=Geodermatophilus amargosae TaxID=1296565 RepID=A0A1I7CSQ0_9ACTN|nr:iron ABC transporter permease [Geodermatophilus amargosae]SFU02424.1 iron complex transport system permease protein [Geodermatophilus amargosae]